jgi:tetratricopeptide (TPR) repeat protein
MLKEAGERQAIEALSESDLVSACEQARELVAARPADEEAARLLREIVERAAVVAPPPRPLPQVAPVVDEAKELISAGQFERAEILLRDHLKTARHDPPAMHLMAEIAAHCDLQEDAERILQHAAAIHSESAEAWAGLGMTLYRIACQKDYPNFLTEAVAALDEALKRDPGYEDALAFKAAVLVQTRVLDQAREAYEALFRINPNVFYWVHYGYVMKTVGEFGRSVAAYRTAVALDPTNGPAWWGLANLKVARFFNDDIERMKTALEQPDVSDSNKVDIGFALAKALDQSKNFELAAATLRQANDLRAAIDPADPEAEKPHASFVEQFYTPEFMESRRGWGNPAPDPIFILGMPRSGSTLVEQILSSHSMIEGTEELFVLLQISSEIASAHPGRQSAEIVSNLGPAELAGLGTRYIELTRRYRRTDRPLFTDKNPANWQYTGLILNMLPNAKIIDTRRNPMDCCFSNYWQHFQAGAHFTYSLRELGLYYADYVRAMRHLDQVAPGRVHRVIHDDIVDNPEPEIRRLLDYVGVPFEESCLRFYETERPVHTPSSEQVRQPINRSGFGKWRNYEPWLGELKEALGDTLENWRG